MRFVLSAALLSLGLVTCTDSTVSPPTSDTIIDTAETAASSLVVVSLDGPTPSILAGPSETDREAAEDLADLLSRVTGQALAVVDEPDAEGVVMHVGRTDFVDSHVDLDDLYADGFVMRHLVVDGRDHLVLAGARDPSSQWAVEYFLREHAGVRWLFPVETYGEHVPQTDTLSVPVGLDETQEPDFAHRGSLSMYYFNPGGRNLRNFANGSGEYGIHALQNIFTGQDFLSHPEWFSWFDGARQWWEYGNGWQICTARSETVTHAVEHCVDRFESDPDADTCSVGPNDGTGLCTDDLCNALRASQEEPYNDSEMWWLWVNAVASELAEVDGGAYADRWVESLAYSWSSAPPRFALEPNVAITKSIVFDYELDQAEEWSEEPANAQSVNLYSYPMCSAFLGFRHYPHAMADFLHWSRDTLGSQAHVPECGPADWTFDGPKYAYVQALQWDADADPAAIMEDFCEASYGAAAEPMCAFWQQLEDVWEARESTTSYDDENTRLLFYQWVGWQVASYIPPNDELRTYTIEDVDALDASMAEALEAAVEETEVVQYRVDRMEEAWSVYRTFVLSRIRYLDGDLPVDVTDDTEMAEVRALADEIAGLRADRDDGRSAMAAHPELNVKAGDPSYLELGWLIGYTIFSFEQGLLDGACSAISSYIASQEGTDAAVAYWETVAEDDPLFQHALSQIHLLETGATELLTNGGFEQGLDSWTGIRSVETSGTDPLEGSASALMTGGGVAFLRQEVAISTEDRLRLTAWARYGAEPDEHYVPADLDVAFYDATGTRLYDHDPTRAMVTTTSPEAGWTRVQTTMTAPTSAATATVTLQKQHDVDMYWDEVSLERILPGPEVEDGVLFDTFDGESLDLSVWFPAAGSTGTEPPRVEGGELVYDAADQFSINSHASFDALLEHSGEDAYTLRLHLRLLDGADPETIVSFGIKTGTDQLSINETGFMFYSYWSDPSIGGGGRLNAYCYQDGTSTCTQVETVWSPWDELFYTMVFEPETVTVHVGIDDWSVDPADPFMQYSHQVTDLAANGSVFFKLQSGPDFAVGEVSLDAAGQIAE